LVAGFATAGVGIGAAFHDSSSMSQGRPAAMTLRNHLVIGLKLVAVLAFVFHLIGVAVAGLVPEKSALWRAWLPLFRPYLEATGNMHRWQMFVRRPEFVGFRVSLVGRSRDGRLHRFGPLLPELGEFDGSLRSLKYFDMLRRPKARQARALYLRAAKARIRQETGLELEKLWLYYQIGMLNDLDQIRKTNKVATVRRFELGP
jgi:hypothetical protein